MANPISIVKYAFVAGEISPQLVGRSDLEKYDLALAECRNWFVDYRGGLSTRPGTEFCDFIDADTSAVRLFPFKFAPNLRSSYEIMFGDGYIRFMQDGRYVLEAAKNITDVNLNVIVLGVIENVEITSAGHGFSDGDLVRIEGVGGMVELNNRTYVVTSSAANTFELTDFNFDFPEKINGASYGAYTSGGTVARVYTVSSPYDPEDLELLRSHQSRSSVIFTHPDYPPYELIRVSHNSWTMAAVTFGANLAAPSGLSGTPSTAGTAGVAFCVTAVDASGNESIASRLYFNTATVDYSSTGGESFTLAWTAVANAVRYNVYRSNIVNQAAQLSHGVEVGYVGYAFGPRFVDNNIIPDFTITPPVHENPFAPGAIEYIEVTAPGAGYTNASVVTVTGAPGTGFVGYPIVSSTGTLLGILIVNGGEGYVTPTVSVSVGAGATFTVHQREADGTYPRVSTVFQQRRVFAASDNDPLTAWGSVPASHKDFDVSRVIQEDDSYEFELDSEDVAPILHLIPTRSGIVLMTASGIWQVTGGSGVAVTPTNALADQQSYTGVSEVPPLRIDTDLLTIEAKSEIVRLLGYSDLTRVFAAQDLSILARHLASPENRIVRWGFAANPYRLVYAAREDGSIINLVLNKEQNVFGWSTFYTQGFVRDVLALDEGGRDSIYMIVERFIPGMGGIRKLVERVADREFIHVEDACSMDSCIHLEPIYPAAKLVPQYYTGLTVFQTSPGIFTANDVGKIIRAGTGKARITAYTAADAVSVQVLRDFAIIEEQATPNYARPWAEGEWTMDEEVTTIGNLWHLNQQLVDVVADGSVVLKDHIVANGSIPLSPASRVVVGLKFRPIAKTLPPTTQSTLVEGRAQRVAQVKLRQYNSRGVKVGPDLDHLESFPERSSENAEDSILMQTGMTDAAPLESTFDFEGAVYIVQDDPLPATILSLIQELDVGDNSSAG